MASDSAAGDTAVMCYWCGRSMRARPHAGGRGAVLDCQCGQFIEVDPDGRSRFGPANTLWPSRFEYWTEAMVNDWERYQLFFVAAQYAAGTIDDLEHARLTGYYQGAAAARRGIIAGRDRRGWRARVLRWLGWI